jgi:hypothetical protein
MAYHQIVLAEEDRHKTAFYGPGPCLYEYTRVPFGLHCSIAAF